MCVGVASRKVHVVVDQDGEIVDGPLTRPVRLLPTGVAGVVYGGEVYALYEGSVIILGDQTYDRDDCPSFVGEQSPIPFAARPRSLPSQASAATPLRDVDWYVESNRLGHYLVFDADRVAAERVVDLVSASVLGVRRWDASHRPADNGRHYDWFVRLDYDGEREECVRRVRELLAVPTGLPASVQPASITPQLHAAVVQALNKALEITRATEEFTEDNDRLLARVAELQREVEGARSRVQAAENLAAQHRRQDRAALARAKREHAQEVDALRRQLDASTGFGQESSQEVVELRSRAEVQRIEIEQWVEAVERSDDAVTSMSSELQSVTAERDTLAKEHDAARSVVCGQELELSELRGATQERRTVERLKGQGRLKPGLELFLDKLFPNCELDEASVEQLCSFKKPAAAVRALLRIDEHDPHLDRHVKKVKGHEHWWEISKIHTGAQGDSAMGRIYYRIGGELIETVVHLKRDDTEQRRFMRRRLSA